ncbi:MAG: aldo/keto reductase [Pseudomonadota bacterium]
MHYRKLGNTGLRISELSLGSWVTFANQTDVARTVDLMAAAYAAGVNFFDNAETYAAGESERVMGKALKQLGWRRGSYLVSTKLYWGIHDTPLERNTLSRKYLLEGIAGSLQRLDLEYVDIVYCHRDDADTSIEEIVRAMHSIIERGQALYWGTSEWEASRIIEALAFAEANSLHKPVVEQPVYNLFEQHRFGGDYDAVYPQRGYGTTTWSPLASGVLTGKYRDGIPADSRASVKGYEWLAEQLVDADRNRKVQALKPLADDMGASLAQFAIAWCLQNAHVSSVLTGASRVEQVHENLKALEYRDRFTPELMAAIDEIITSG